MSTGKLVVLSAPSGTGKTSVCKKLLKRNPNWKFSVSATTRPLREDEVEEKIICKCPMKNLNIL